MVLAGDIDARGSDVKSFKEDDPVFAFDTCGFGAYAEYKCIPADGVLAPKPSNLTYEQAAAIPYGGMLAWHFLTDGGIRTGQAVLIYGASGAVGTSAVQLAKHPGARVTGVCSGRNLEPVRSLGTDAVIDYTKEDFTPTGERYDLVFIAIGNHFDLPSQADCRDALVPGGKYISVNQEHRSCPPTTWCGSGDWPKQASSSR
jgi:NADPH:quinone reductase-like Zn-dependent oxidoreductase